MNKLITIQLCIYTRVCLWAERTRNILTNSPPPPPPQLEVPQIVNNVSSFFVCTGTVNVLILERDLEIGYDQAMPKVPNYMPQWRRKTELVDNYPNLSIKLNF